MVTPRIIANRLLENDEDFDVSGEIDRLTASGHPGIEIESEGNHWNVYKKSATNLAGLGTPGSSFIGEITYDDMADMPKETMTPENIAYWDSHRWFASAGFRENERQMCKSFEEAVQWIIAVNIAKTAPVRESENPDDPEAERYVRDLVYAKEKETTCCHAGYQVSKGRNGTRIFCRKCGAQTHLQPKPHKYSEALDPDDPELYVHPEKFTGQPTYEKMESDLRVMLRPYYPEVRISRRPAKFAEVFKGLQEYFTWTIHCKRELPLPLPKTRPYAGHRGHDPNSWREQAENWLNDWAERNGFRMTELEIYGRLRKDPTIQFTTWRLPPAGISRRSGQPIKENEDDMTPEQIMNDLLPKVDWNKDLEQDLWGFHPYGVTYTVVAAPNLAFVLANTYFPPEKDDFARRLHDFVVDWLTKRRILIVKSSKLYTFKHVGASPQEEKHMLNYPRWTAGVSINSDWPSDVASYNAPTVEVRQA